MRQQIHISSSQIIPRAISNINKNVNHSDLKKETCLLNKH